MKIISLSFREKENAVMFYAIVNVSLNVQSFQLELKRLNSEGFIKTTAFSDTIWPCNMYLLCTLNVEAYNYFVRNDFWLIQRIVVH